VLVGLLLGAGSALQAFAATPDRFDGAWAIEVETEQGGCERINRFYVVIENGAVKPRSMMGEVSAEAVGRVRADGVVASQLGAADDPVVVRGRLADNSGSGRWSAPAKRCSGPWRASRR
jgi:hypothetical protein